MPISNTVEPIESRTGKLACAIVFILAIIIAAWFRFNQIGIKPFHHDEGVNAYFLMNLADHGAYKYDPTNYHGPTLYYFAYIAMRALGETDLALRFTPALFGVLTVTMVWLLRKRLGPIGTPAAALFLALSPGPVYFSRDFIHEMSFGCFSLGIVVAALRYFETKRFLWLALMSVSAGLMFATKETAIITAVVLVIALICAAIWDIARKLIRENQLTPAALVRNLRRESAGVMPSLDHYSSIFTHRQGVTDAVRSVLMWSERSGNEHVKSFWYYIGILLKLELPLLAGSLLAGIFILWRGTRFWLFAGAWTLGMTLGYSIIGYKTPWLMISFLVPMALVTGYAVERLYRILPLTSLKLLWALAVVTALIFCGQLSWRVNFEKHDDNSNGSGYFTSIGRKLELKPYVDGLYGYVYAQTDRDFLGLIQTIKDETARLPSRNHTGIYVASPDYWPMPWYLRDFDQVAYSGTLPANLGEPPRISQAIVIAEESQRSALERMPGWRELPQSFSLRPAVRLIVFVRDENLHQ
jgi:uncharacterized protein (TIGR03663 family)